MVKRMSAEALLFVTVGIYAFNFTAAKFALDNGFEPLTYSSVRFVIAAGAFTVLTWQREDTLRVARFDLKWLGLMALVGVVFNQLVFAFALDRASASSTSLLFGTFPIFVAIIASAVGTEKLRRRHWAATLVSFAGVALVAGGAGSASFDGGILGVLLGLGIAVTWAGYSVGVKPLLARYSAYRVSAWVMILGAVPLTLVALAHLIGQDWSAITELAWLAFAYTTVVGLVLANVTYFTSIERVGAARASLYLNLQPFLGALLAVVVLSEELSGAQVGGGAVIALGIIIARGLKMPRLRAER
ncbi:MAG: DMT family transporter [Gaiellaceae bacterium]